MAASTGAAPPREFRQRPRHLIVGARLARGEHGGDRDEPGDRLAAGQGDAIGILGGARSRDRARATGRDGSDVGAAAGAEGAAVETAAAALVVETTACMVYVGVRDRTR